MLDVLDRNQEQSIAIGRTLNSELSTSFWSKVTVLLRDVLLLGILCAPFAFLLMLNGGNSGSGPYISEVASNVTNEWQFLKYVVYVISYAMLLEGSLRLLQARLGKHMAAIPLVLLMAAIYGATHFKFHLAGCVYASSVGLVTACFFQKSGRFPSLMVWHACWELAAIGFVVISGTMFSGECRTALLFEYKNQQMEAGKLLYAEGWGWVDQTHLASDEIRELTQTLYSNRGQTLVESITHRHKRFFFSDACDTYTFRFEIPIDASEQTCQAMAASARIQACIRNEDTQGQGYAILGATLSSYSFEDLPTELYSAFVTRPDASAFVFSSGNKNRWQAEGKRLVSVRITSVRDFEPLDPTVHQALREYLDVIEQLPSPTLIASQQPGSKVASP